MSKHYDAKAYSLFTKKGQRKYLNAKERQRFYEACGTLELERRLFCKIIYYTGARIGEVQSLRVPQIDFEDKTIIFATFKQRKEWVYRQIPLPDYVMGDLLAFLDIRRRLRGYHLGDMPLWSFSLRTASRIVKNVMMTAQITGAKACSRGLRHGFAVHAVTRAPLTLVQRWLGHASLRTTAIYLQVSGIEEREWSERVWQEAICTKKSPMVLG